MTDKVTEPTWMTVRDVAHDTRLSERGIRQMIAEGRLPAYKVRNPHASRHTLRIRRADVDALFSPLPTVEVDQT